MKPASSVMDEVTSVLSLIGNTPLVRLERMDAARRPIMDVFCKAYGDRDAAVWFQRWRMFYMAVAELFGYARGNEWGIGHYLFEKRT